MSNQEEIPTVRKIARGQGGVTSRPATTGIPDDTAPLPDRPQGAGAIDFETVRLEGVRSFNYTPAQHKLADTLDQDQRLDNRLLSVRERHQFEAELAQAEDKAYSNSPDYGQSGGNMAMDPVERLELQIGDLSKDIAELYTEQRKLLQAQKHLQEERQKSGAPVTLVEPARVATALLGLLLGSGGFVLTDIQTNAVYGVFVAIGILLASLGAGEWIRNRVKPVQ